MPSEPTLKLIHQDSRGEMYQILLPTGQEIMLLHSNAGAVRGGHSHTALEMVTLVTGELLYHKKFSLHGDAEQFSLIPGECIVNWPHQPHYGEFLQDSWLIEFKYGPNSAVGQWENVDHEPFRKMVRERMQP